MIDPQALAANAELRRLLERAIQRLPEQFRTAFVLREVEGLSVEETAEYLGIPPATVKTRDHRARNLLRGYLSENIDATIPQTFPFLGPRCDRIVAEGALQIEDVGRALARLSYALYDPDVVVPPCPVQFVWKNLPRG